ncbi:hypothetical protein [Sporomusa rhizae]|uniref:hypothetical protein n=1 Tax=Sporomusa rhizae TaxID=357999 RepID=UPI00352A451F
MPLVKSSDMIIVTSQNYVHQVKTELAVSKATDAHILLETDATQYGSLPSRLQRGIVLAG